MNPVAEHQPEPEEGVETVLDYVLRDVLDRASAGKNRYGMCLQTNNGRDALMDAYQEAIDLVMYLRQAILERNAK